MHVLVTGATGKVGRRFVDRLLPADSGRAVASLRALCHNRSLPVDDPRLSSERGSIAGRETVARALAGIDHVVHRRAPYRIGLELPQARRRPAEGLVPRLITRQAGRLRK